MHTARVADSPVAVALQTPALHDVDAIGLV